MQTSRGFGGRLPQEIFPLSPLSWVSESFRQDISQISTWKVFFVIKDIFIMKNLTTFLKMMEAGVDGRLDPLCI